MSVMNGRGNKVKLKPLSNEKSTVWFIESDHQCSVYYAIEASHYLPLLLENSPLNSITPTH